MAVIAADLSAVSRLFSSAVFRELASRGKSGLFARLARATGILRPGLVGESVASAFDAAYDVLSKSGSRDEYVYKAALTQRVLLGKHNLRTACMLNEFRAGTCKADIAILNGTSTAYEIKSERDSLNRLERQIESYRRVFASVFVIAGERHVDSVLDATGSDIGVLSLSSRYQISTVREATNDPSRVSPVAILDAVRTDEAKQIARLLGRGLPELPNTAIRRELRKVFETLPPQDTHAAFVTTLKKTRDLHSLEALVGRLPRSLHAAVLSVPLRKTDHERLIGAVETPLDQALAWN